MDFKNKKGFITVYVMLAMMFFVVFVVTASVIASRKLKLQTEANSALYEIYNKDVDHIIQNVNEIPIYTQEQFEQILRWLGDTSREKEYMNIKDFVYTLDNNTEKFNDYQFVLKTDIYLNGSQNTNNEEKEQYPYIPSVNDYHNTYKVFGEKIISNGYNIFLKYNGQFVLYASPVINIYNGEDFLKIGTGADIGGVKALTNMNYKINNNIEITEADYENIEHENITFDGEIDGNNCIVSGLNIDKPFFEENKGIIKDFSLVNLKSSNKQSESTGNFGIIAEENNGTISAVNIMCETTQTSMNKIENVNNCTNVGGIVGINSGTIENCIVQGIEIINCRATNIGGIAGINEGTITNITVQSKLNIKWLNNSSSVSDNVGGIVGKNVNSNIEKVTINGTISITSQANTQNNVGGVIGYNYNSGINKVITTGRDDACINITVNGGSVQYLGGVVGKNESSNVVNCYVDGEIDNSNNLYFDSWNATGGIVGRCFGNNNSTINYCYSNIEILYNNKVHTDGASYNLGTGGIVGTIGFSGSSTDFSIENCIYVNSITSDGNIKNGFGGKGGTAGGIVGNFFVGNDSDVLDIDGCYMNGVIPDDNRAGGIIGGISLDSSNLKAEITGTSWYNTAFRSIGYFVAIPAGVEFDTNLYKSWSSEAENSFTNLREEISNNINSNS